MPQTWIGSAIAVALLIVIACGVLFIYRAPKPWQPSLAVGRGVVQLAVISLVLAGVIQNGALVAVVLLIMFAVAWGTATRRIGWDREHATIIGGAMLAGVVTTTVVIFASGALPVEPRYALAIGGIIIGNAMNVATLTSRRFVETVRSDWEQVEAWMALGAKPRASTHELARQAVYSALIPATDQTKTTGLVTLPGAFVGAIFGGLSPLEAGRFQIIVLAGIMAAAVITAVIVAVSMAPVRQKPAALS